MRLRPEAISEQGERSQGTVMGVQKETSKGSKSYIVKFNMNGVPIRLEMFNATLKVAELTCGIPGVVPLNKRVEIDF